MHESPEATWEWDGDAPGPGAVAGRRRAAFLVVACLPWLVVALLATRPAGAGSTDVTALEPAAEPHPDQPTPPTVPAPAHVGDPTPTAASVALQVSSGGRLTPDVGDAVTVAVLAARGWFRDTGPQIAPSARVFDQGPTGYVEHLWVEAIDAPWSGHVVVTLGAIVLEPTPGGLVPEPARVAVPVALDADGARAAGRPYLLPPPAVTADPPRFSEVEDPDAALRATDALAAAGYRVTALTSLARSDGWPWSATFEGSGPGQDVIGRQVVWLRPHLGGFVVAGWLPPRAPVASASEPDPADPATAPQRQEVDS